MRTIKILLLATAFLVTTALQSAYHPPSPVKYKAEVSKNIYPAAPVLSAAHAESFYVTEVSAYTPADGYRRLKRNWRTLSRNGQRPIYNTPPANEIIKPVNIQRPSSDVAVIKELHVDPGSSETCRSEI